MIWVLLLQIIQLQVQTFPGDTISETISGINPSGGTKYLVQIFSTVTQITTSNVTSDVTLVGHVDTDGSSNFANSVIADDASNTARPLENDGTTKSEISLNGSRVSGTADLLSATDGQFVTVTADAGSPVLTARITGSRLFRRYTSNRSKLYQVQQ